MWTERREWKLVSRRSVGIGVAGINAGYCERAFSGETQAPPPT